MKSLYLGISCLFFIFTVTANAQQGGKINPRKLIEWTLEEKVKAPYFKKYKGSQKNLDPRQYSFKEEAPDMAVSEDATLEAEVHAAINPTDKNNIVVSPIQQDLQSGGALGAAISCPIYYTKDFGQTWQKSSFKNMPTNGQGTSVGGGDPVFAYDADGKLYFTWIDLNIKGFDPNATMGIYWAYSEDGGATWKQETDNVLLEGKLNILTGEVGAPISDKQWMAVDRTNSSYRNNLYTCFVTIYADQTTSEYQILCKTKPADSAAFRKTPAVVASASDFTFVQYSSVAVDKDGNAHVTFFGSKDSVNIALWHSVSKDGGLTFSSPKKVSDVYWNLPTLQGPEPYDTIPGISTQRLYPSPYLAGDQKNGNLYFTWTAFGVDKNEGNGSDVYISRSVDGGETWSNPVIVNDDVKGKGTHQYYSSVFVDPVDSKVSLSWYDRRDDNGNMKAHYYVSQSEDFGATFGGGMPASSVQTDFATVGQQNQGFGIGEYTQVLSADNYIIPVWADGRKNNGDMDIYIAFINPKEVGIPEINVISDKFSLKSVYPNPVKGDIRFGFNLQESSQATLYILDLKGRIVKTLAGNTYGKGDHEITFNSSGMANGTYLYRLETQFGYSVKKLVIEN